MELEFKTDRLKKKCLWGKFFGDANLNMKLTQKLWILQDAKNLLDIKLFKQLNLHKLKWSRKYELAIDVDWRKNPNRIIFETLNWEDIYDDFLNDSKFETITKIKILEIKDYH